MTRFIEYPWIALILGLCFAALWALHRKRIVVVTACTWAGYCIYEYLMYARVLCTGDCNIRVDLLLLYPLLLAMSVWALVSVVRARAQ
jgi:hypothetical protein